MDSLFRIAEAKIREAVERGDFEDLPGKGKALDLEEFDRVPEELRAAYTVCKNAGVLPPEVELRNEVVSLRQLLAACTDEDQARELRTKLSAASLRFEMLMERHRTNPAWRQYGDAIRSKLTGR